jgi:hypothetical protein
VRNGSTRSRHSLAALWRSASGSGFDMGRLNTRAVHRAATAQRPWRRGRPSRRAADLTPSTARAGKCALKARAASRRRDQQGRFLDRANPRDGQSVCRLSASCLLCKPPARGSNSEQFNRKNFGPHCMMITASDKFDAKAYMQNAFRRS